MPLALNALRAQLSLYFREIFVALLVLLFLLLYLTSQLSTITFLSETFFDLIIYTVYLLLVFIIGAMTFVVYNYLETPLMGFAPFEDEERLLREQEERVSVDSYDVGPTLLDSEQQLTLLYIEQERLRLSRESVLLGFVAVEEREIEVLMTLIEKEHPQLLVVLCTYLSRAYIQRLYSSFDAEKREMLLIMMQESHTLSFEVLKIVDGYLQALFSPLHKECSVLHALSDQEVRQLLKKVHKKELMFALKGATQELQEKFFVNMSNKTAALFRDAMERYRTVDQTKSVNALKNLYLLAQQLREDGKIRAT